MCDKGNFEVEMTSAYTHTIQEDTKVQNIHVYHAMDEIRCLPYRHLTAQLSFLFYK